MWREVEKCGGEDKKRGGEDKKRGERLKSAAVKSKSVAVKTKKCRELNVQILRHSQPHCFNLIRVDVATADSAVHVSVAFLIPFAIFLALNTCLNVLKTSQHLNKLSKDKFSVLHAKIFDRRVSRCVSIIPFIADVFASSGALWRFDFDPTR